ncbi:DUF3077 domain-containing protein [Pseudomonas sp. NPDC089534]|uniref:DUF3077 domain-containing protein n=1 Tax=Pseudomonas sp. NPDC089534 TaxID=3364468 RepID=UPI003806726D
MTTHTTVGHTSFSASTTGKKMFRVNSGIPLDDAMETISLLQHYANQLTLDAAMNDNGERFIWSAFYLGEMAKALLDDVNDAMFLPRADA